MSRPPRTLYVLTNNPDAVFQHNVIVGANDIAGSKGYRVEVLTVHPQTPQVNLPATGGEVGVLVIANALADDALRQLHAGGTPVSLVCHQVEDVPIPSIMSHNRQGISLLMAHLTMHCGRRLPVYISGDMNQNDGKERARTFEQECLRYDLHVTPDYILRGDFEPQTATESLNAFIARGLPFDAIVSADYLMGIEALSVLRGAGARVPEDVSVVAFGDAQSAEDAGLTTVGADIIELGRRGTRQLIGQMEGLHIRGLTTLSTQLIVRTSCGG